MPVKQNIIHVALAPNVLSSSRTKSLSTLKAAKSTIGNNAINLIYRNPYL